MNPRSRPTEDIWYWATQTGERHECSRDELRRLLGSGRVPQSALVWKPGWESWQPAASVAELEIGRSAVSQAAPAPDRSAAVGEIEDLTDLAVDADEPEPAPAAASEPRLERISAATNEDVTPQVPLSEMLDAARAMTKTEAEAQAPAATGPSLVSSARSSGLSKPRLLVGGLLVVVLVGGLLLLTLGRWEREPKSAVRTAAPAASGLDTQRATTCSIKRTPLKLLRWAIPEVIPSFEALPNSNRVAMGYAGSGVRAAGITLDLETLRLNEVFAREEKHQLVSVTPLAGSGEPSFDAVRMRGNMAFSKTVAAAPPFRIGMNQKGLVISSESREPEPLWPLPPGAVISVPAIVEHRAGYTIAVRAGHKRGSILVGLLRPTRKPMGELTRLNLPETELGIPDLAISGGQTALAVAMRPHPTQGFSLVLSLARYGQAPDQVRTFKASDQGQESVEFPRIVGLPDDRFALVWTQGTQKGRRVRLQVLDSELQQLGTPIDVSRSDHALGARSGEVFAVGGTVLVVYFATEELGHSLWGGTLACGLQD